MEKKTIKRYDSSQEVEVQSNYAGKLIYVSKSTGFEVIWDSIDEINYMTIGDLKEMASTQRDFFKNNWIVINDEEADDIYRFLRVSEHYNDNLIVGQFVSDIKKMKVGDIRKKLSRATESLKRSIAQAVLIEYENGSLDSVSKIKELEKLLNVSIISTNDEDE